MLSNYLASFPEDGLFVMQGRLSAPEDGRFQSFPRTTWQNEIEIAQDVPLRGIEWIFDTYGAGSNPLETPEGRHAMRTALTKNGVCVRSVCADYFMDKPLVGVLAAQLEENVKKLRWLISICQEMGVSRIVLPFVDTSCIVGREAFEQALRALHSVVADAERTGVELHLETDLPPHEFRAFLAEIDHPMIRVNYDSGNSGSLGYVPAEEFAAYGHRIGSVHVKDRKLGGGTVPIGEGAVDFRSLRRALIDIEYRGDFVMQAARGPRGGEFEWLQYYVQQATSWLRGEIQIG